jgi:hypothetical protein
MARDLCFWWMIKNTTALRNAPLWSLTLAEWLDFLIDLLLPAFPEERRTS